MKVLDLIKDYEQEIIEMRRHLHQIPEVGLDLVETSKFVASKLDSFSVNYKKGIGTEHTILASIEGYKKGSTIAFRADMDALPVQEETELSFQSTNGNMHACGHDAHTAIMLGVAKILQNNRDKFKGKVILIFQTAEEISRGARPIVESGILQKLQVEKIYGLHLGGIAGGKNKGKVFLNPGSMMACLDSFKLNIKGKGSHGAYPNQSIDPITASSYIVTGLQEIISREISPTSPGVISIGSFHGGSTYNVIPNDVEIEGTARAVTEEERQYISKRIGEVAKSIGEAFRCEVEYDYYFGAPPLINDKEVTEELAKTIGQALGEEKLVLTNTPVMGGEDFAEYLQIIPGSFMFLENMMEIDGKIYPHHHPKFALDESEFINAAAIFVQVALNNK